MAEIHPPPVPWRPELLEAVLDFVNSACLPRPRDEWSESDGEALWWCWRNGEWLAEPPYIGSPLDCGHPVEVDLRHYEGAGRVKEMKLKTTVGGWPGYHTHWTPIPIPRNPK